MTGPTICTTSGLCVPGASCAVVERFVWACFVRFPWANSATAMATRQNTEAVKMRRLKNPPSLKLRRAGADPPLPRLRRVEKLRRAGADCEVDFFFLRLSGFFLRRRVAGAIG